MSVARERDQQLEVTPEERALLDRVPDHSRATNAQAARAEEIMLEEARRLDEGEYSLFSLSNLF